MANLKDLKNRIKSVKSTQKITSAMKMVAAAKLRRAQENAEASRPYSTRMSAIINSLASKASPETAPALLAGTGQDNRVLLIVVSADRGLCGGFNGSIIRATRRQVEMLKADGKTVDLLMVGRKAKDALQREFADIIVDSKEGVQGTSVSFADIDTISDAIIDRLENGQLDRCQIIFNRFVSAISQEVNVDTLIPVTIDEEAEAGAKNEQFRPGKM